MPPLRWALIPCNYLSGTIQLSKPINYLHSYKRHPAAPSPNSKAVGVSSSSLKNELDGVMSFTVYLSSYYSLFIVLAGIMSAPAGVVAPFTRIRHNVLARKPYV